MVILSLVLNGNIQSIKKFTTRAMRMMKVLMRLSLVVAVSHQIPCFLHFSAFI